MRLGRKTTEVKPSHHVQSRARTQHDVSLLADPDLPPKRRLSGVSLSVTPRPFPHRRAGGWQCPPGMTSRADPSMEMSGRALCREHRATWRAPQAVLEFASTLGSMGHAVPFYTDPCLPKIAGVVSATSHQKVFTNAHLLSLLENRKTSKIISGLDRL